MPGTRGLGLYTVQAAMRSFASSLASKRLALLLPLGLILLLAAGVRVYDLRNNPPGFFADEAAIGYNAYTILTSGRDEYGSYFPVFFRSFGEYKFPVFIYGTVPFIALLGLTEEAVRMTATVFGTLTVLAVFLLASAMFDRRTALMSAFLLAITPWHIHYSRIGFELISFPLLLTLGLFLLFAGLRRPRLLVLAAGAFALTFYTYGAAWIIAPLTLGMLALLYGKRVLANPRPALLGLLAFSVLLIPLAVHIASGHGQTRLGQTSILNLGLRPSETAARFSQFYRSYFSLDFLLRKGDNSFITRHFLPGYGHLFWFQLPLVLIGAGFMLWKRRREGILFLWLVLVYPLSGALSDMSPISSRTILGPVVLAVLAGYGAAQLASAFPWRLRVTQRYGPLVVFGALTVLGALGLASYLPEYHRNYPNRSADFWGWQYGPREIVGYFKKVEAGYDDLVMVGEFNAPEIFFKFYAPEGCPKCRIGDLSLYNRGRKQLFALKPAQLVPRFKYATKHTVTYPNGEVAFLLVEAF
ncbi:MAG: glycosyltransferase family 39 protein [Chloroflexi bacterium]|nr:glycosyltransferase family 39 protein [Chloroflexota bacterium]